MYFNGNHNISAVAKEIQEYTVIRKELEQHVQSVIDTIAYIKPKDGLMMPEFDGAYVLVFKDGTKIIIHEAGLTRLSPHTSTHVKVRKFYAVSKVSDKKPNLPPFPKKVRQPMRVSLPPIWFQTAIPTASCLPMLRRLSISA